jgi:hypothetical protein
MPAGQFHHFGVPTKTKRPNETYIEGGKVFVTDPSTHPYNVEFVRFEPGSPMPGICQSRSHAAFMVPDLDAALKGQKIIVPPFDANPTLRVAFILDGDALIELMQTR